MIRRYYLINIDTISKININEEIVREIDEFLNKYYERYTGLYLKSKDFIRKLNYL